MSSRSVGVQLQGRDYQIRSDADAEWLQRVAGYVDNAMNQIREQTNTVDTLDVALLTSLNLARELVASRAGSGKAGQADNNLDSQRLKSLIDSLIGVRRRGAGAARLRFSRFRRGRSWKGWRMTCWLPWIRRVPLRRPELTPAAGGASSARAHRSGRTG